MRCSGVQCKIPKISGKYHVIKESWRPEHTLAMQASIDEMAFMSGKDSHRERFDGTELPARWSSGRGESNLRTQTSCS
jgi:hypothetical protein